MNPSGAEVLKPEFAALNTALLNLYGVGLFPEQVQCLADPTRAEEAAAMLDDMGVRLGVNPATVEAAKATLGPHAESPKEAIERALQALGFRMEHSLAVFDGGGHALVEISTGDMVDPPNDEVLALAVAWTAIESPHALLEGDDSDLAIAEHSSSTTPSLAAQWSASPGKLQCTGPIVALSDSEVIQGSGRGAHVVWDRREIQDVSLEVGENVTIHESGVVRRASHGKDLGR